MERRTDRNRERQKKADKQKDRDRNKQRDKKIGKERLTWTHLEVGRQKQIRQKQRHTEIQRAIQCVVRKGEEQQERGGKEGEGREKDRRRDGQTYLRKF